MLRTVTDYIACGITSKWFTVVMVIGGYGDTSDVDEVSVFSDRVGLFESKLAEQIRIFKFN